MNRIFRLGHWIKHRLRLTRPDLETWCRRDGEVMIGYRCPECGALEGIHPFYAREKNRSNL